MKADFSRQEVPTEQKNVTEKGFFGRRHGKKLRPNQQGLLQTKLPDLRLDLLAPPPEDLRQLFANPVEDIRLEIGFGAGEHLLHHMQCLPHTGFIGVEPFVNGMAKFLAQLEAGAMLAHNLRLYDDDAILLLDWLPARSLAGVDLFYPDPWPKKRHWKRRVVHAANLDRIARVLRVGGVFRFASDIDSYVDWTLSHCHAHPAFSNMSENSGDWRTPYPNWPSTRYEQKALREGRHPAYLTFHRL